MFREIVLGQVRNGLPCLKEKRYLCQRNKERMITQLLTLAGALGMFLYGMSLMSTGLQKAAGSGLRKLLGRMTSNPIKGALTGLGVTSVIQSSSATTVMVVGFVSAGLLTLNQAISVIMGANIGTTMTAWIISIFGFKADISTLAIPLMILAFILTSSKKDKRRNIGEFLMGFCLLFLGLSIMKSSVPDISSSPESIAFLQKWSGHGFLSVLLFLLAGTVLTLILQSSSATVALTLIMLNMGWIGFEIAAAMVLGENIGTTITANIAAAVGNTNARRAALAHTVFNLFGVFWALAIFNPFVDAIQWGASKLTADKGTQLVYGLSLLHTTFNLINTGLLIGFIPSIGKLVCKIIPGRPVDVTTDEPRLKYINAGLISTPELGLTEATHETLHFASIMRQGLDYINNAITNANDATAFGPWREKLVKYEAISDRIEYEIVSFLNKLDKDSLSAESLSNIRSIIRITSELESLGDSGEAISRSISTLESYHRRLTSVHLDRLSTMTELVRHAYDVMIFNLEHIDSISEIANAEAAERAINEWRNKCRDEDFADIERKGESYFESVFFTDILEELENMGDFLINISQSCLHSRAEF